MLQTSRLKVGWVAPCVGIGGADAYMLGLIRYCHNLKCTGVAIADATTIEQAQWAESYLGNTVKFHQIGHNCPLFPNWEYYEDFPAAIYQATFDADIIIQWGCKGAGVNYPSINKPIIELVQNEDKFAREIVSDNDRHVDYRVAVSETVAKHFKADRVIYNAVDPARCCPRYGRDISRRLWGFENRKVILFLGRFVDEKNPASLIAALKHLPPEWCVLYVGRGYRQEDLVKEAQRHVGGKRVYFAAPQYHVGDLLAACDVFVLPSDFEGHPLAVCEAWLAGTPTVCTEFNVMVELREKFGNLCTYVPKKCTPQELAKGILRADSGAEEVEHERALARAVTWNNFTLPTVAAQWEETIHEFYYDWYKRNSRMQVYEVEQGVPLETSKAHMIKIDTSQDSLARWHKV